MEREVTIIVRVVSGDISGGNYHIVYNIRLPRIIVGIMVGINLALAGAILQGVLKNPLADPGLIGVSSGAGLAAMFIMILFPEKSSLIPVFAFVGAITAALVVYLISWKGGINPYTAVGVIVTLLVAKYLNILMLGGDMAKGLGIRVEEKGKGHGLLWHWRK